MTVIPTNEELKRWQSELITDAVNEQRSNDISEDRIQDFESGMKVGIRNFTTLLKVWALESPTIGDVLEVVENQ